MPKISVIIVTYNSLNDISNCIESIYNYCDIPNEHLEIIIVDNSEKDVHINLKCLISQNYKTVKLIRNEINGGYGQGNNIGIKASSSEIVCIMNPDVLLKSHMFSSAIEIFAKNPRLAMIGGKQKGGINLSFWIRPEYEFFILTSPLMKLLNRLNLYNEKFCFLSGALLFIKKDKFKKIGLFDENIFLYREESDIQKRFLKEKYSTHFEKSYKYLHLIDDRNGVSDFSFKEEIKSTKYYMDKYSFNFNSFLSQRYFYSQIMSYLYMLIGNKKKYLKFKEVKMKFKMLKTEYRDLN